VNNISRQQFMTELARLLTFMYEEDRQRALGMYERMFDITDDEQGLTQQLQSPTRQAVVIARAYDAKDRKLSVSTRSKADDGYVEGDQTPKFVLAINKVFDDLFPDSSLFPENEDQVSFFDLGIAEKNDFAQKPAVPSGAVLLSDTQRFRLNLPKTGEPAEKIENASDDVSAEVPPEEGPDSSAVPDEPVLPEQKESAVPEESGDEIDDLIAQWKKDLTEPDPRTSVPEGTQPEKEDSETPAPGSEPEGTAGTAETAETEDTVPDGTEEAPLPGVEVAPEDEGHVDADLLTPFFGADGAGADRSLSGEAEGKKNAPDAGLAAAPKEAPLPEEQNLTPQEEKAEEKTPEAPPAREPEREPAWDSFFTDPVSPAGSHTAAPSDDASDDAENSGAHHRRHPHRHRSAPVRRETRTGLLILYLIPAIPCTLALLALLLVPALLFFGVSLGLTAAGAVLAVAAFGGFSVLADLFLLFGIALVILALGLLFLWLAVWTVCGLMAGLVRSVKGLGKRFCVKEVPAS